MLFFRCARLNNRQLFLGRAPLGRLLYGVFRLPGEVAQCGGKLRGVVENVLIALNQVSQCIGIRIGPITAARQFLVTVILRFGELLVIQQVRPFAVFDVVVIAHLSGVELLFHCGIQPHVFIKQGFGQGFIIGVDLIFKRRPLQRFSPVFGVIGIRHFGENVGNPLQFRRPVGNHRNDAIPSVLWIGVATTDHALSFANIARPPGIAAITSAR